MGNVTESDNRQDKDIAVTITRVDGLERRVDRLEISSENIAQASASQAKSIKILEKVMYGVLALALGALVKVIIGVV